MLLASGSRAKLDYILYSHGSVVEMATMPVSFTDSIRFTIEPMSK